MLDRNTFRGRALADVLIEETTNSSEKIEVSLFIYSAEISKIILQKNVKCQVYCCNEDAPGDISDKRFCGQGVSCLTVCGEGAQDDDIVENVDSDES